jgi:SnoaL-like polyketide cyclase
LGWSFAAGGRSVASQVQRLLERRGVEVRNVRGQQTSLAAIHRLFSTGDEALADEVLGPEVAFHGTTGDGELRGVDAMKAFVAGYRRASPDAQSTVEDQVAEGDKVVTRWRARSTHRGSTEISRWTASRSAAVWGVRACPATTAT